MPALTEAELKLLQALVYQECGMHFDERRTHFLQDRLQRRLRLAQSAGGLDTAGTQTDFAGAANAATHDWYTICQTLERGNRLGKF